MSTERSTLAAQLADRILGIRARIALAADAAGRDSSDILLCAACKEQESEIVRLAADLGIDAFGENRVQEMAKHLLEGAYADKPCHFIGRLQTNKVRQVVGRAALIQSVDNPRLLTALQSEAARLGVTQDILLECNVAAEVSKGGVPPGEIRLLVEFAVGCPNVRLRGLMAIPPAAASRDETRRYFAILRRLLEDMKRWDLPDAMPDTLSMGMSGDFEAAVGEGATIVRVGRAIFGERTRR